MIETALLPFQFGFMQNAFWVALLLAPPTAILSCFLVLKGWSLMGDAISHAVLPGIVIAYLAGIPLMIGAFGAAMTCALATGYLDANSRVKRDTVMGVVFSGMFGFGLVLFTKIETNVHLDHILFGNMLGVGAGDLWTAGLIAAGVTTVMVLKWRDFLLHAFDPAQAHTQSLPTGWLHYGLLAILSATIVATLKAVGLILAIGLLIAPGAIAFLIVRTFREMMIAAVAVTMLAMLAGVYASFWIDSAPGPTVVLMLTLAFIIAFAIHQLRAASGARSASADDAERAGTPKVGASRTAAVRPSS